MGITAGALLITISVAHIIYGETKQIPALKVLTEDSIQVGSLRIMIIQGGLVLFAAGIIQILISVDAIILTGVARYFPISLILINSATAFFVSLLLHREIFKITIPQFIIFILIISLQLFSL
jgi:hypothetical protein